MSGTQTSATIVMEGSPNGFLSDDDLYALTERRHKSKVAAVLQDMGIRFIRSPSGRPLVLWSTVEHLVGQRTPARHARKRDSDEWKPAVLAD